MWYQARWSRMQPGGSMAERRAGGRGQDRGQVDRLTVAKKRRERGWTVLLSRWEEREKRDLEVLKMEADKVAGQEPGAGRDVERGTKEEGGGHRFGRVQTRQAL